MSPIAKQKRAILKRAARTVQVTTIPQVPAALQSAKDKLRKWTEEVSKNPTNFSQHKKFNRRAWQLFLQDDADWPIIQQLLEQGLDVNKPLPRSHYWDDIPEDERRIPLPLPHPTLIKPTTTSNIQNWQVIYQKTILKQCVLHGAAESLALHYPFIPGIPSILGRSKSNSWE